MPIDPDAVDPNAIDPNAIDPSTMENFFVYGSLQPGAPNEHVLAHVEGKWQPAVVRGRLVEKGWGASMGYPGLVLDEGGDAVRGHLLTSPNLDAEWPGLDELEGEEYERVEASVILESGETARAQIYVLRPE